MPQVTAQGKNFTCETGANLRQVLLANGVDLYNGNAKILNYTLFTKIAGEPIWSDDLSHPIRQVEICVSPVKQQFWGMSLWVNLQPFGDKVRIWSGRCACEWRFLLSTSQLPAGRARFCLPTVGYANDISGTADVDSTNLALQINLTS